MKTTEDTNTNERRIKKEWSHPEITELPVEETSQLDPPNNGEQEMS